MLREGWLPGAGGGDRASGDRQAEEGPGAWEPEITFHRGLGFGGPSPVCVPLGQDAPPPRGPASPRWADEN